MLELQLVMGAVIAWCLILFLIGYLIGGGNG